MVASYCNNFSLHLNEISGKLNEVFLWAWVCDKDIWYLKSKYLYIGIIERIYDIRFKWFISFSNLKVYWRINFWRALYPSTDVNSVTSSLMDVSGDYAIHDWWKIQTLFFPGREMNFKQSLIAWSTTF